MRPLRLPWLPFALRVVIAAAPAPAAAQAGADTSRAKPDSLKTRADSARSRSDSGRVTDLFGQKTDLGFQFNGRFESKLEKTQNERCVSSQFFSVAAQCNASFQPVFDFQFGVKTGGTFADRVHVNVDYNSTREFDASNNISLYYEGRRATGSSAWTSGTSRSTCRPRGTSRREFRRATTASRRSPSSARLTLRAIAAQQKGNVVANKVFTVGGRIADAGPGRARHRRLPDRGAALLLHRRSAGARRLSEHRHPQRRADAVAGRVAPRFGPPRSHRALPLADRRAAAQSQRAAVPAHRRSELAARPGLRGACARTSTTSSIRRSCG